LRPVQIAEEGAHIAVCYGKRGFNLDDLLIAFESLLLLLDLLESQPQVGQGQVMLWINFDGPLIFFSSFSVSFSLHELIGFFKVELCIFGIVLN
jgi:hypothetical protein